MRGLAYGLVLAVPCWVGVLALFMWAVGQDGIVSAARPIFDRAVS